MADPSILLSISIVAYRSDPQVLRDTLASLARAVSTLAAARPADSRCVLVLVDNDTRQAVRELAAQTQMVTLLSAFDSVVILDQHGNVGYGQGHNLAWSRCTSRYHLVLNPDVTLAPEALIAGLDYLDDRAGTVLLAPQVLDPGGRLQFLCKRYPSVFDLLLRGFAPLRWQSRFAGRLARYEMQDVIGRDRVVPDPPLVSGCFMLFRAAVLRQLNGFDPRYFLYFEDYDLSLRAARLGALAYVPAVCIVHRGGGASRKGFWHIRLFLVSAVRFFMTHGWKFW